MIDLAGLLFGSRAIKKKLNILPPNLQLKIPRYYYENIALLVSKFDKDTNNSDEKLPKQLLDFMTLPAYAIECH